MTQNEKNLVLNRFMGWRPGQKRWPYDEGAYDVPPFNFYEDTPEARERTRLLKDEFVRRTGYDLELYTLGEQTEGVKGAIRFEVMIDDGSSTWREFYNDIESHAVLDAIYEAIK